MKSSLNSHCYLLSQHCRHVSWDNFILLFVNKHEALRRWWRNNNRRTAAVAGAIHVLSLDVDVGRLSNFPHQLLHISREKKKKRFAQPSNFEDEEIIISHNLNFNFACAAVPTASSSLVSQSFSSDLFFSSFRISFRCFFLYFVELKEAETNRQVATSFLQSLSNEKFTRSTTDGKTFSIRKK